MKILGQQDARVRCRIVQLTLRSFLAHGLLLVAAYLGAQTAPQPEVRLEPHDGKVSFRIGEPIRLDLVIRNPLGAPMMVNVTDYSDNSDPIEISPKTGWIAWQGPSGHDYADMTRLGSEPVRIPIRVDQVAIFREPGHYEVHVTERRVEEGSDLLHLSQAPAVTTNPVGIDLEAMTEDREAEIVRRVKNDLANASEDRAGAELREAAVARLAALQGNVALDEKVKLLISEQDDFRSVARQAWATTRDLKRQLDLIQAAWRNPEIDPAYDMPSAMDETRQLLAGRPLSGWQMIAAPRKPDAVEQQLADSHRQEMADLLNSMPQRIGASRRDAAYLLVEFGGLSGADQARAREYAVEEFPYMDDLAQHMLLETPRPPLHDARLLPTLRTLLDRNPTDNDALAAYLDIAPEEATPYVVRAVCAPKGPPPIETFAKVKDDRLPQVDGCLLPLLNGQLLTSTAASSAAAPKNTGRANFIWKQRVMSAARFGSPALLPAIEDLGKQQLAANPNDAGVADALLAAEMRDDPKAALMRLQRGKPSVVSWYGTNKVFEVAHQPFPPAVEVWLRDQVRTGSDDAAEQMAYELAIGGTAEDRGVIEDRLAQFRASKSYVASERSSMMEANLVSALFGAKAWTLTAEERAGVTEGCLTNGCRIYAKH